MKSKIHKITLTLRFQKRFTRQEAVTAARAALRGSFNYPNEFDDDAFEIVGVRKFYANPRRTRNDEDAG